ncbi:flagellar export chaperone FliS [sulfur-oxidizing endosymbiont of Gigantopelta aegis]|uniref:flagellar export chaperone FliS n=1 Tax=sulfur-oxidizing endosymbiont of Gigantopelta aegis TaxID=2794934 RepID=UPI0018DD19D1
MNYTHNQAAMNKYAQVGNQSTAAFANPHRLIQMLMEGALEKISKAKGFMKNGDIAKKGEHISWAISIIEGLRVSLDHTQGGKISENLESLYIYMNSRLTQANLNNSLEMLDEVTTLLVDIKSGWDAIPQDVIDEHAKSDAGKRPASLAKARI